MFSESTIWTTMAQWTFRLFFVLMDNNGSVDFQVIFLMDNNGSVDFQVNFLLIKKLRMDNKRFSFTTLNKKPQTSKL